MKRTKLPTIKKNPTDIYVITSRNQNQKREINFQLLPERPEQVKPVEPAEPLIFFLKK